MSAYDFIRSFADHQDFGSNGMPEKGGNLEYYVYRSCEVTIPSKDGSQQIRSVPEGSKVTFFRSPYRIWSRTMTVGFLPLTASDEQIDLYGDGRVRLKNAKNLGRGKRAAVNLRFNDR